MEPQEDPSILRVYAGQLMFFLGLSEADGGPRRPRGSPADNTPHGFDNDRPDRNGYWVSPREYKVCAPFLS